MEFLLCLLCVAGAVSSQKDPHTVGPIVHLFEWRWKDIGEECERFLSPYGFGGVQVSPPNENVIVTNPQRPWWERYQPISYKLETRSGNETEFIEMVDRCNRVGVRIYVDAVINHMTGDHETAAGTGGSTADTKHLRYPSVPYGPSDFNKRDKCSSLSGHIDDFGNAEQVRNCELLGLHDLDQGNYYVQTKILEYLNRLTSYGVAGFRIDAVKHMWPGDMETIVSHLNNLPADKYGFGNNERPFIFQEVIDLGGEPIKASDYTSIGRVTEFKYGAKLGEAFRGHNQLRWFSNFGEAWSLMPSGDALVFIDNHDNQRGHGGGGSNILTHKEPKLYKMAVAFMLAWPYGFPRLMSSFSFDNDDQGPPHDADYNILPVGINSDQSCSSGWACEHRWRAVRNMVTFMNVARGSNVSNWWSNDNYQIAFCRDRRGFIAINGEDNDFNHNLQTTLPSGTYCDVITGDVEDNECTGKSVQVDASGRADISIGKDDDDKVMAIHIESRLSNA